MVASRDVGRGCGGSSSTLRSALSEISMQDHVPEYMWPWMWKMWKWRECGGAGVSECVHRTVSIRLSWVITRDGASLPSTKYVAVSVLLVTVPTCNQINSATARGGNQFAVGYQSESWHANFFQIIIPTKNNICVITEPHLHLSKSKTIL